MVHRALCTEHSAPTASSLLHSEELPVVERLQELGIVFERFEHPAIATAGEGEIHWAGIEAVHCKNLFLRNQKGSQHYLVILAHTKRADLRAVADQIGDGKLSFASPERLLTHLKVTPGSVSPFGLIHDGSGALQVIVDEDLRREERLIFHPNLNTASVTISVADLERFLATRPNRVRWLRL